MNKFFESTKNKESNKEIEISDQQSLTKPYNSSTKNISSGSEYVPSEESENSNKKIKHVKKFGKNRKKQNANKTIKVLQDIILNSSEETKNMGKENIKDHSTDNKLSDQQSLIKSYNSSTTYYSSGREYVAFEESENSSKLIKKIKIEKILGKNIKKTKKNKKIKVLQDIDLNSSEENKNISKDNIKDLSSDNNLSKEFIMNEFFESTHIEENYKENNILEHSAVKPSNSSNESKMNTEESSLDSFRKVNSTNDIEIVAASKKEGKRVRNKTHVCYYCNKKIINMARHFELVHYKETEIAKFMSFPKKSSQRKANFAELIKVGDFYHNCNVLATKTGELILVRRPTKNELKFVKDSDYGPCPNCLGFMLKKHLWHHMRYSCKDKVVDTEKTNAKHVMSESNALVSDIFGIGFTKEFHKSIISNFRSDELGDFCRNDILILKFGAMQFEKYGNTQSEFIRQTMRQLARLTLALNKLEKKSKTLSDFLIPEKFDLIIQATKEISMNPLSADSIARPAFHTPSLALKIGHALRKCIAIQRGNALRAGNLKKNKTLLSFKELLDMEWNIRISSNALSTLYKRKLNAKQLLPITDDLVKLSKYIDTSIMTAKLDVDSDTRDNKKWTRLATLCLSRIILFNKRRSGEASKMKMSDFISRPSWEEQNTKEIRESLTTVERKLAENMSLVEVEGKRGRKVPILLPPLIKESINSLIRHRDECKISLHNKYVFARSNESSGFLRGHDCLKKICEEIRLENPDAITGTKLRKYVATVCQLFNMSENEYDWLARHLGHDITVHREFYRMHESAIELTKISRILMAVDQGEAHQYVGKRINEISVEDLPALDEEKLQSDISEEEEAQSDEEIDDGRETNQNINAMAVNKLKTKNIKIQRKERNKERKPQPWSRDETQAVLTFFKGNIKNNIIPTKKECEECLATYPVISSRPWKNIKYFVKNQISKNRKKMYLFS
ncbi:unnamed protein product [Psylliodes chrysocephalus]|uniref:Uncharacterized protein n=1 Tax=Psylliodes chrysocephalus TaxID=3402493 RepID=A0A9P0GBK0_9CUCU|nr:unnamed protein product [Psylliodes chrysocephala]